jgi:hypothetical protein
VIEVREGVVVLALLLDKLKCEERQSLFLLISRM